MDDDCGTRFLLQLYRICCSFLCRLFGLLDFVPSVEDWLLAHGMFGVWTARSNPGNYFVSHSAGSRAVFDGAKQQPKISSGCLVKTRCARTGSLNHVNGFLHADLSCGGSAGTAHRPAERAAWRGLAPCVQSRQQAELLASVARKSIVKVPKQSIGIRCLGSLSHGSSWMAVENRNCTETMKLN